MTLTEIQDAVNSGRTVHWANKGYHVAKDRLGQWLIICDHNGSAIGLTWRDGKTLNGMEDEFYTAP